MNRRRVYIFINGILNNPGDAAGWTDRAVTWTHGRTSARAEKFEYFCGVLTRRLFLGKRARQLAELVESYSQGRFEVVLVGHSNGCELICRALAMSMAPVKEVHLISGACGADFSRNGLNTALLVGRLRSVSVYVGSKDAAMRFAAWTGKLLGLFGLGYGTLGLKGPLKVAPEVKERVNCHTFEGFSHSTIFEPQNFERLMRMVAFGQRKENQYE